MDFPQETHLLREVAARYVLGKTSDVASVHGLGTFVYFPDFLAVPEIHQLRICGAESAVATSVSPRHADRTNFRRDSRKATAFRNDFGRGRPLSPDLCGAWQEQGTHVHKPYQGESKQQERCMVDGCLHCSARSCTSCRR